jgi:oligoendopeptidase F
MFTSLPKAASEFMGWTWVQIEPYYQALAAGQLSASSVGDWLADWSLVSQLVYEMHQRLYVATTLNTVDQEANQRFRIFLDEIRPHAQAGEQRLKEKLLASGLEPAGFEIPLRNLRAEAALYREQNLPLLSEDLKLWMAYDKTIGAQTIEWEGKEVPIPQLQPVFRDLNRDTRESAWHLAAQRQLADRQTINELWIRYMGLRRQLAANAGCTSFRGYCWQQLLRLDYRPEDCTRFHQSIEETAVPAAVRLYERRRQQLGVKTLRPWDIFVDSGDHAPLHPYTKIPELIEKAANMFRWVDPQLGSDFDLMRKEGLLDLDNRKNKAPGGYCTDYPVTRRPFIFMNAVGLHDDVDTLLHEAGHAFHVFEMLHLPYHQQFQVPLEFMEVASIGMELLGEPYLLESYGGFYSERDAARARVEHLSEMLRFWPYVAVVDAFQHWVYENHDLATDPAHCDAKWTELWHRYMLGVDWSGLEDIVATGWQRKPHILQSPFYYIEYGLAQMGAVQIWRNALRDQREAVAAYRRSLSLGGTVTLPQLFAAAGAKLAFDTLTLGAAVELVEKTIEELDEIQN